MAQEFDAIIVGGGHNGLTCAAYLAKSGLSVLVTERREIVGGAAVTEEIIPGFRASTYSYIMGGMNPKVIADLELAKYGLEYLPVGNIIRPVPGGDYIVFADDKAKSVEQIRRFSKKDAAAFPKFYADMTDAIELLRRLVLETPFDPARRDLSGLLDMARFAWRYRDAGNAIYKLYDALTMSAYDYVSQWFESDVVRAYFCYWAAMGSRGPHAPNTATVIIHHLIGTKNMGFARGGMGSISNALADCCRDHGVEIKTDAPVAGILTRDGRATGIRLENGDTFKAKAIASNLDVKTTFQRLLDPDELPDEFNQHVTQFRAEGRGAKFNIAMERPPRYRGFDADALGVEYPTYAHIAPTVEYMERAADAIKYGWYSESPIMSTIVPSMADDSLAPAGKAVVHVYASYAPYELKGASWDDEQNNFTQQVMSVMDEYVPGFSSDIIAMDTYLPRDVERILGMPGGSPNHGEIALDQLFFKRPVPHYADYRSPVTGLYQCGSSSHPGGSVTAVAGHNAAREILRDWRKIK